MKDLIQIKIAETDAEREAAYQLRYEVFGLEEGDHRYSDHERKFWIDQDDGPNSTVLVAFDMDGICLASTRLTLLRQLKFLAMEAYHFEVLAALLNLSLTELTMIVGRWDRGVVRKSARGLGILQLLEERVADLAMSNNCTIIVGTIKPDNHAMFRAVAKAGYRTYPVVETYRGFTAQLIYKDLREYQPKID